MHTRDQVDNPRAHGNEIISTYDKYHELPRDISTAGKPKMVKGGEEGVAETAKGKIKRVEPAKFINMNEEHSKEREKKEKKGNLFSV